MKKYILPSLKMTLVMLVICSVFFPLLISGIAHFAPGKGGGETLTADGRVVGYANIGQSFTQDKYFWGRPSAVSYNAAASGGSNKGPTNADYLRDVAAHIDSFLVHNPTVRREEIPAEMVTYSGSGLDPDISPASAYIQVARVAAARGLSPTAVRDLVDKHVEGPFLGLFGPSKVNVLKLNIALDELK